MARELSQERLKQLLNYDPETGLFRYIGDRGGNIKDGDIAKPTSAGYVYILIDGVSHGGHRIAWVYHHGVMPKNIIDHVNGVKHDNRVANLRDVTPSQNSQNLVRAKSHNSTGFLGVSQRRKKFEARIVHNKKLIHLGLFDTPELAHQTYLSAKRKLHSGCSI